MIGLHDFYESLSVLLICSLTAGSQLSH